MADQIEEMMLIRKKQLKEEKKEEKRREKGRGKERKEETEGKTKLLCHEDKIFLQIIHGY